MKNKQTKKTQHLKQKQKHVLCQFWIYYLFIHWMVPCCSAGVMLHIYHFQFFHYPTDLYMSLLIVLFSRMINSNLFNLFDVWKLFLNLCSFPSSVYKLLHFHHILTDICGWCCIKDSGEVFGMVLETHILRESIFFCPILYFSCFKMFLDSESFFCSDARDFPKLVQEGGHSC